MIKKFISVLLTVIVVFNVIPGFSSDVPEMIELISTDDCYTRNGSSNINTVRGTSGTLDVTNSDGRTGYMKFNVASGGYNSSVYEQAYIIYLKLYIRSLGAGNLLVYGIDGSDKKALVDETSLTHAIATDAGLNKQLSYELYNAPATRDNDNALYIDITQYAKNQADGVVAFRFYSTGHTEPASDRIRIYAKESVDYAPSIIVYSGNQGKAMVDARDIVLDSYDITESLELPSFGANDTVITWGTEDNMYAEVADNVLIPKRPESSAIDDPIITLIANVDSNGAVVQRNFNVAIIKNGTKLADKNMCLYSETPDVSSNEEIFEVSDVKNPVVIFDTSDYIYRYAGSIFLRFKVYENIDVTALDSKVYCAEVADGFNPTWNIISEFEFIEVENNGVVGSWCEYDVTEFVNSATGKVMFVLKSPTEIFNVYGNSVMYKPQLAIYNYETESNDEFAVLNAYDTTDIEDKDRITENIALPTMLPNGVSVEWESSDDTVVDIDGTVTRSYEEDKHIVLTATFNRGSVTKKKEFNVVVLQILSDEVAVERAYDAVGFEFLVLSNDFELKTVGLYGTAVSWQSLDETRLKIQDNKCFVIRPNVQKDSTASLKAIISLNDISKEKLFTFTIPREPYFNLLTSAKPADDNAKTMVDDDSLTTCVIENGASYLFTFSSKVRIGELCISVNNAKALKGISLEFSDDGVKWDKVLNVNELVLNDDTIYSFNLPAIQQTKYAKITFNTNGVCEVSNLYLYSNLNKEQNGIENETEINAEELFKKLTNCDINNIISDFELPLIDAQTGDSYTWTSSNDNYIKIQGNTAKVYRDSQSHQVVLMLTVNGNKEIRFALNIAAKRAMVSSGGGGSYSSGGSSGGVGNLPMTFETVEEKNEILPYSDINDVPWAKDYIIKLTNMNVLSGNGDGNFKPMGLVKREEVVKMLVSLMGLNEGDDSPFSDLEESEWYVKYINSAYSHGIVKGKEDGTFGIGESITRQDICVMVARAIDVQQIFDNLTFNDAVNISDYAKPYVGALVKMGIISGNEDGNFNPMSYATRAETAKIIALISEFI